MLSCPDFSGCKVIVIGDAMLDRYWHGDTSRISPEAPVPVVKIERNEERVGGAANVAVNLQALGAATTLISVIGEDESGKKLSDMLVQKGVQCEFVKSPTVSTTLKLRVLGRHQQLIRLDFEDKENCDVQKILDKLQHVIAGADVLILSDYAKGVISDPQAIIQFARDKGVKVLVDPKNADLSVYRGASVLTPNLGEFEAAVGPCSDVTTIEQKGSDLVNHLFLEALLVTRGSQGMTLLQSQAAPYHISAKAREVFDITGAGDTVIAVMGASMAVGCTFKEAAQLANLAGGLSVGRLGTATITRQELQTAVANEQVPSILSGVISLSTLLPEVIRRKAQGEKIVFTNGCFDILHRGHVTYMQQARALGDCLIVGVNDDGSVKRLKGATRPINPLEDRLAVIAALDCIDYVVPFSEDTPSLLIEQLTPDVLVKGGDYTPLQIAGAAHVISQGGRVEILPFVPGKSTTEIIEKMISSHQHNKLELLEVEE